MESFNETEENIGSICNTENEVPKAITVLVAIAAIIVCIVGFLGNMLTILALPHVAKLRHSATWFVVNLAVCELVFCVIILPMQAVHLFHLAVLNHKVFDDHDSACQVFVYVRFVLIHAEIFSIAAIAVNRCVLIAIPKKYPLLFTTKKTIGLIICIWTYSLFVMVFPLAQMFGIFSYNECTNECDFGRGTDSETARKVYLANGFLIPCVIIVVSYSYIFYKARQSARRMMAFKSGESSSEITRPAEGLRTRDLRIARTIAVIFVVFLCCCGPVTIAHYYGSEGQIPTTLLLLHPLYWLQYCLNSLIYVLMNKQYREAYISYISVWWPRFRTIVERWYQETTEDDTSTNVPAKKSSITSKNSSKKSSAPRKQSMETPQSTPKADNIKMSLLKHKTPTPEQKRSAGKDSPVGELHRRGESPSTMGVYKPIKTSLKLVSPETAIVS